MAPNEPVKKGEVHSYKHMVFGGKLPHLCLRFMQMKPNIETDQWVVGKRSLDQLTTAVV